MHTTHIHLAHGWQAAGVLTACLSVGTFASPQARAQAPTVDLVCAGTNTATFTPGLTLTEQTVAIYAEGEYTTCTSLTDPSVTSGEYTAAGEGSLSCIEGGHAGQFTIDWNTEEYSTIEFTNSVALRPLGETVVVATGTVVDGKFEGDEFTGTFTLFNTTPWECLFGGVTETTGPTTLLLTSPPS